MIEAGWYTRPGLATAHFYKANGRSLCHRTEWRPGEVAEAEWIARRCNACDIAYGEAAHAGTLDRLTAPAPAVIHPVKTVGDLMKVLRVMDRDWPVHVRGEVADTDVWALRPHVQCLEREGSGEGGPCVVIIPTAVERS